MVITASALWNSIYRDVSESIPGFDLFLTQPPDVSMGDLGTRPDSTVRHFAGVSLLRSIVKKFQDEIDQEAADLRAFEKFSIANEASASFELNTDELGPYDEIIVGEFRKAVYEFFFVDGYPLLDHAAIAANVDFGPGSAPGADRLSFVDKIGNSVLTSGGQLPISLFHEWVKENPTRVEAETCRLLEHGPPRIVKDVKITPVPKTAEISRLVKPEPLLNMFFQKGVQAVLERQLKAVFGIDLTEQPALNAELARRGSLPGGKYATIDLRSASDYLSRALCEEFIPRSSFLWIDILRSTEARVPDPDAESGWKSIPLHMMCTMGNAFCFPLQTILFACAVTAVYKSLGLPLKGPHTTTPYSICPETGRMLFHEQIIQPGNWGVFGDDIVVLDEAYGALIRLLKALGSIPNEDKSFSGLESCFRESCGSDWFKGTQVRGVYCKSLKTLQDRFVLINNLTEWSSQHKIDLTGTIRMLIDHVERVEVPPWENPECGIRMPLACVKSPNVYKAKPRERVIKPGDYSSLYRDRLREITRWQPVHYQGSFLYKRYVPVSDKYDVSRLEGGRWMSKLVGDPAKIYRNHAAVLLGALKGTCRGGFVSIRLFDTRYKSRIGVAPCWDHPGKTGLDRDWHAFLNVCEKAFL